MSFQYNHAGQLMATGQIDLSTDDIRVMLVMTNTTADTEDDVQTISGFTALDEFDGANYARSPLDNGAVAKDSANDRTEYDADDETFGSLGNGTRQAAAHIIYKHVTDDTDSIPLWYVDTDGYPTDPNGADLKIQMPAEGVWQIDNNPA